MKTNTPFLSALVLTLLLAIAANGQTNPKLYSEVYYHKLKPGHTPAEALAIESEWKKIHQAHADDGWADLRSQKNQINRKNRGKTATWIRLINQVHNFDKN